MDEVMSGYEDIWHKDVEDAFLEAYELYPSTGRTKFRTHDGGLLGIPDIDPFVSSAGRNELISKHIYDKTGKMRTRKQVSSHIQVLVKKHNKYAPPAEKTTKPISLRKACQWMMQDQGRILGLGFFSIPASSTQTLQPISSPTANRVSRFDGLASPVTVPNTPKNLSRIALAPMTAKEAKFDYVTPIASPTLPKRGIKEDSLTLLLKAAIEMDAFHQQQQ